MSAAGGKEASRTNDAKATTAPGSNALNASFVLFLIVRARTLRGGLVTNLTAGGERHV